jgi:hypothetical protein
MFSRCTELHIVFHVATSGARFRFQVNASEGSLPWMPREIRKNSIRFGHLFVRSAD